MPETIIYKFYDGDIEKRRVELTFDEDSFRLSLPPDEELPNWTRLDYLKCGNCNIAGEPERCPAAQAIAHFLPAFADDFSYAKAVVEVETPNRIVVSKTTLQNAVASLMGLAMATSGCPRTAFLRPMARFHLPFATDQETIFRSLGAWLLGEFIRNQETDQPLSLAGLKAAYEQISIVNAAFVNRIRAAVSKDAPLNAVLLLDTFALIAGMNIDGGFEDLRHIFRVKGEPAANPSE